jgi:hypothetical protein
MLEIYIQKQGKKKWLDLRIIVYYTNKHVQLL